MRNQQRETECSTLFLDILSSFSFGVIKMNIKFVVYAGAFVVDTGEIVASCFVIPRLVPYGLREHYWLVAVLKLLRLVRRLLVRSDIFHLQRSSVKCGQGVVSEIRIDNIEPGMKQSPLMIYRTIRACKLNWRGLIQPKQVTTCYKNFSNDIFWYLSMQY